MSYAFPNAEGLATLHHLVCGRDNRSLTGLQKLLSPHHCSLGCPRLYEVFRFVNDGLHASHPGGRSFVDPRLLGRYPIVSGHIVCHRPTAYVFDGVVDCSLSLPVLPPESVVVDLPLTELLCRLGYRGLIDLAAAHGISCSEPCSVDDLVRDICSHRCWLCARKFPCLVVHTVDNISTGISDVVCTAPVHGANVPFPPMPVSPKHKLQILREWVDLFHLSSVYEKPCAICASFTSASNLLFVPLDTLKLVGFTVRW